MYHCHTEYTIQPRSQYSSLDSKTSIWHAQPRSETERGSQKGWAYEANKQINIKRISCKFHLHVLIILLRIVDKLFKGFMERGESFCFLGIREVYALISSRRNYIELRIENINSMNNTV